MSGRDRRHRHRHVAPPPSPCSCRAGREVERRDDPAPDEQPAPRRDAAAAARAGAEQAEVGWEDVARICVGTGPGRVHRPAARDLHRPRARAGPRPADRRRLEPGGARARRRARRAPKELDLPGHPDVHGPVLAVIDARRGEVFAAVYRHHRTTMEPIAITPAELAERAGRAARVGTQPDAGRRRRGGTLSGGARTGRSGGAVRRFPRPPRQRPDGLPARTGEGARRPRRPAPGLPPRAGRRTAPPPIDRPARRRHRGPPTHVRRPARRSSPSSGAPSRRPWSLAMFVLELSKPTRDLPGGARSRERG